MSVRPRRSPFSRKTWDNGGHWLLITWVKVRLQLPFLSHLSAVVGLNVLSTQESLTGALFSRLSRLLGSSSPGSQPTSIHVHRNLLRLRYCLFLKGRRPCAFKLSTA